MKTGSDRKYTPEFRQAAVKQVLDGGRSMRSLEMSPKTLANWVGLSRGGQRLVSDKRSAVSELEAELKRLRADNARLRMEREILKKAAAYFAKESL